MTDGGTTVVTDNQFVAAELNAASKSIVTTVKSGELAAAAASMGLQAMAQRADSILADNIAERTSSTVTDLGPALWVNVGGESYETDSLGRGAALKSDMGWEFSVRMSASHPMTESVLPSSTVLALLEARITVFAMNSTMLASLSTACMRSRTTSR